MNTASVAILGFVLALSAMAEQSKAPPDPILVALKAKLEREFQKLDPKPTFEFPDGYEGRSLTVRFKTRNYVVHHRKSKGGFAETTGKYEGPSGGGFLLRADVQQLGEPNQLVTPQVVRRPYWDSYINVCPVKNTRKQIYFCLSGKMGPYDIGPNRALIEKIKAVLEEGQKKTISLNSTYGRPQNDRNPLPKQAAYRDALKFKVIRVTPIQATAAHRLLQLKVRRWYGKIDREAHALRQKYETQELDILFPAVPDAVIRVGDIIDYRLAKYISDNE